MKPIYIYTMSISLQIAGALILLLWSLGNTKKKVIKSYFPGSNIAERDDNNRVYLRKEKLRKKAKDIYMNRIAFIFLIIGYGLSLFGELADYNEWKALVIIQIESICIIFIGLIISKLIAIIKFKEDIYVDYNSLKEVDTVITNNEVEDMIEDICI